jgi:hypothetical protein
VRVCLEPLALEWGPRRGAERRIEHVQRNLINTYNHRIGLHVRTGALYQRPQPLDLGASHPYVQAYAAITRTDEVSLDASETAKAMRLSGPTPASPASTTDA